MSDSAQRWLTTPPDQRTLLQVIVSGDRDAAAGFFDGRAPTVREYCAELCPPGLVDDATIAAFLDFRGRLVQAPADTDLDDLLRRATRTAAASKMHVAAPAVRGRGKRAVGPVCLALPELLAAHRSGELPRNDELIRHHLRDCRVCQYTEERLAQAEDAFDRGPSGQPPEHVRATWLQLAAC